MCARRCVVVQWLSESRINRVTIPEEVAYVHFMRMPLAKGMNPLLSILCPSHKTKYLVIGFLVLVDREKSG